MTGNGKRGDTLDLDGASLESEVPGGQNMRVVLRDDRDNRHAGLHGEMKRALLERQQLRAIGVTPGTLGKDEDALTVIAHFLGGAVERLDGSFAVGAVNEDGAGEGHEPAEEGDVAEGFLSRDAAVGREDGAKHEDVEFGLMVPDEHGGPGGQVFGALDHVEAHAGGVAHNPFEAARGGPLGNAAVAGETEHNGGYHAVGGAEEERAIGGKTAGDKGGAGDFLAEGEERERNNDEGADARCDVGEDGHGGEDGARGGAPADLREEWVRWRLYS